MSEIRANNRRRVARLCTVMTLAALAAGCAEPVSDADESFRRCMESAGFELHGSSSGIYETGDVGIGYEVAEPRLAVPAERVARACVQTASLRIGRRVFLED